MYAYFRHRSKNETCTCKLHVSLLIDICIVLRIYVRVVTCYIESCVDNAVTFIWSIVDMHKTPVLPCFLKFTEILHEQMNCSVVLCSALCYQLSIVNLSIVNNSQ